MKIAREIVQENDPVLHLKAKPFAESEIGSKEMKSLIEKMRRLLAKEKNGVGIAAPQVGVSAALFIVSGRVFEEDKEDDEDDSSQEKSVQNEKKKEKKENKEPHPGDKVFINPELIRISKKKEEKSEGCLSVRGKYGTVLRHEKASIKALDENGNPITYHGTGLLAQIFQHEMDHLNGILFTDKAVRLEDKTRSKEKQN